MSHTPGPWHGYDNGFDGGVVSGWRLCEDPKCGQHYFEDRYGKPRQHYDEWIVGGEPHEGRLDPATPDARLIAAAPDLLEACLYAERNLGRVQAIDPTTKQPCWEVVHAAIAKAKP